MNFFKYLVGEFSLDETKLSDILLAEGKDQTGLAAVHSATLIQRRDGQGLEMWAKNAHVAKKN